MLKTICNRSNIKKLDMLKTVCSSQVIKQLIDWLIDCFTAHQHRKAVNAKKHC